MREDQALREIVSPLGRVSMYLRQLALRELQRPVLPLNRATQMRYGNRLEEKAGESQKGR